MSGPVQTGCGSPLTKCFSPGGLKHLEVQPLTQQVTADMTGHALTPQHDTDLGHHGVQIERRELAR